MDWKAIAGLLLIIGVFSYTGLWWGLLSIVIVTVTLGWKDRHKGPFPTNNQNDVKREATHLLRQYKELDEMAEHYASDDHLAQLESEINDIFEDGVNHTPEDLYQVLDDASLITVIGYTGSGKSQLIFSYLDYLSGKYTPKEFQIRAYDIVRSDYSVSRKEPFMPFVDLVDYPEILTDAPILSDIETVEQRINQKAETSKRILIHITECDLFHTDFRNSVIELCEMIAKHGKEINMQLIYETSRPAEPSLPFEVVSASSVRVLCPVANTAQAENFIGSVDVLPTQQGEMLVQVVDSDQLLKFDLVLERDDGTLE